MATCWHDTHFPQRDSPSHWPYTNKHHHLPLTLTRNLMIAVPPELLMQIFRVFAIDLLHEEFKSQDWKLSVSSLAKSSLVSKLWHQNVRPFMNSQVVVTSVPEATEVASRLADSCDPDYEPKSIVLASKEMDIPFDPDQAALEAAGLETMLMQCKQLSHLAVNSGWFFPATLFESSHLSSQSVSLSQSGGLIFTNF